MRPNIRARPWRPAAKFLPTNRLTPRLSNAWAATNARAVGRVVWAMFLHNGAGVTNDGGGRYDQRVVRARSSVAGALAVAEGGRPAEAERRLRDALGVFERRHRYAAAARAAATLGYLLRERGDLSRAEQSYERARVLFEVARVPVAQSDGLLNGTLEAETEDYVHAKTLLGTVAKRVDEHSGVTTHDDALDGLVAAADRLSRVCTGGPESLERLCSCVQELVGAKSVAVYPIGTQRPLAEVGNVPRALVDRVMLVRPRSDAVAVLESSRGTLGVSRVTSDETELAVLAILWTRAPDSAKWPILCAIVRLAAVVGRSDVAEAIERQLTTPRDAAGVVGESTAVVVLRRAIAQAGPSPYPVLIEGETGSGKELVARALHRTSTRRNRPFCAVNCAALSDELFEAELFGYARGAFTGAVSQRAGLFEEAHLGTLFLDEVADLSSRVQAKLLRAVQEGEVRRLGENAPRRVDVRLVAATNLGLRSQVAAGRFRQDLLFRLAVVRLEVPPLRSRGADLALLARYFWGRAAGETGSQATLGPDVMAALSRHDWPGNVRELENVMAGLAVGAPRRGPLRLEHLLASFRSDDEHSVSTLIQARQSFERQFVLAALLRAGGRPGLAARELGISRQGLAKLMKRLDLSRPT